MKSEAKALETKKIFLLTYLVTALAHLLWIGGIWLAPYLKSRSSAWSGLAYAIYGPICHQVADRSLRCFGQPLAVCARCAGIYLGSLLGLGLYPLLKGWGRISFPSPRVLFILSAPIVLDTAVNFLGIGQASAAVRFATGVLWGTILPFYFVPGMADLFVSRRKNRLKSARASP